MSSFRPETARHYRPDIDGLRAVAVLLVLLYHSGFSVPGGFVGVDVFFVISGYLITGIIWKEILEQRFSFKRFYLRRIKRLLPALLAVVLFCTVVVSLVFMPGDFEAYSKGLPYVLTGLANFHFLEVTQSYFAQDAELLPLIHTWSLAVEEQYYVLWPLVLIAVYKVSAKVGHGALAVAASLLFLLFLVLSEYWARQSPSQAYYLLHARAFELMMGGLLAVYEHKVRRMPVWLASVLSIVGLVLIFASAMLLSRESVFPGVNAFWVCLGSVLVIVAGGVSEKVVSHRLLAVSPMVFVGLLSYSIYLWHWPLVAVANYLNLALGGIVGGLIVVSSLLMAWLNWKFVEQRVRAQSGLQFRGAFMMFFLLPILCSLAFHQFVRKSDGWPQRLPQPLEAVAMDYLNDRPSELFPSCHDSHPPIDTSRRCYLGDLEHAQSALEADFLLLGDSHANSASGIFDVLGKAAGLYGLTISAGSSPFLVDTNRYKLDEGGGRELREHYRPRMDNIKEWIEGSYKGPVILAAVWHKYFARESVVFDPGFEDALRTTLEFLVDNGNEVIIFLAVPGIPDSPDTRCVALDRLEPDSILSGGSLPHGETCQQLQDAYPLQLFTEKRTLAAEALGRLIEGLEGIRFMDPMDTLCDQSICRVVLEGRYIYQDVGHLNYSGGKALGREILRLDKSVFKINSIPSTGAGPAKEEVSSREF